jgi:hypothetical protein
MPNAQCPIHNERGQRWRITESVLCLTARTMRHHTGARRSCESGVGRSMISRVARMNHKVSAAPLALTRATSESAPVRRDRSLAWSGLSASAMLSVWTVSSATLYCHWLIDRWCRRSEVRPVARRVDRGAASRSSPLAPVVNRAAVHHSATSRPGRTAPSRFRSTMQRRA